MAVVEVIRVGSVILKHNSSFMIELAKMLSAEGQSHLFVHWPEQGVDDEEKKSFFDQVTRLNSSYLGGLASYIRNARNLLADSKAGKNPFNGFTPSVSESIKFVLQFVFLVHFCQKLVFNFTSFCFLMRKICTMVTVAWWGTHL
ncbi:UDP-sugar pyrophosphorylase-like [Magnolia sinica]|uniref:UDP-sugar pyrophosphorylase-like n=1 Tax=Magnolia sinica TaxID=86752 RepID=UPI002657C0AE|nr:UDP-sugar pyrophosphorylase-like [Magnolia sinica]